MFLPVRYSNPKAGSAAIGFGNRSQRNLVRSASRRVSPLDKLGQGGGAEGLPTRPVVAPNLLAL
jgi:hypothetical protein